MRRALSEARAALRRIFELVDSFYHVLGERNWVYTDDLSLTGIEQVIDTEDPKEAEARLISYYQEDGRLDLLVVRLFRFEQMRTRLPLVRKALEDYRAGRFYAVVLALIPVMDGFVNDVETDPRRGLHAREPEDMVAWDSLTAHHLGLAHAHKSFQKSFRKTETAEVTELYRHGIVHGMVVNFDNVVVATKAWNRLFAVTDWAEARTKQAQPAEPVPSLRELIVRRREVRARSARIDAWQPPNDVPGRVESSELVQACTAFLGQWQNRQWGPVGAHLHDEQNTPAGRRALLAKEMYGGLALTHWELREVRHAAACLAFTDVVLHVDGHVHDVTLRWVRADGEGSLVTEGEPGTWFLTMYGPTHFLIPDTVVPG